MTLVELLVVSTIIALVAAISFPVLQIVRQREKENRLKEILNAVRKNGIGLGVPAYANSYQDTSYTSEGYRNFVLRKMMFEVASNTSNPASFSYASASFAIASGTKWGTIFPVNPNCLVNPMGYVASMPSDNSNNVFLATITQRFIRGIPENPFVDWFPNATWQFKCATTNQWYSSATWPVAATGVLDIRAASASYSLNGQDMSTW